MNTKMVSNNLNPQFSITWFYSLFTCFQQLLSNVYNVFRNKSLNLLYRVFKGFIYVVDNVQ